MAYSPELKGYIVDVPEVWLHRFYDDRVFHYNKLASCDFTPNTQTIDINGGWSLYPIARLPGQSTLEINMESAEFDAELFAMANGVEFTESPVTVWESQEFNVTANGTTQFIVETTTALKGATASDDDAKFYINGLTLAAGETPGANEFAVAASVEDTTAHNFKTTVTLGTAINNGDVLTVSWTVNKNIPMIGIDNQSTFIGEAILRYPVYNSGEEVKTAGVKGYLYAKVFRVRCTSAPGFNANYKSAMTNPITLSALDPRRADGNAYAIAYMAK